MTATARLRTALEVPAVLLFAWYLRVSCSCFGKLGKVESGSEIDDEKARG